MIKKVGFIGLGAMGAPMARMLLKAGFELYVHDCNTESCISLVDAGARQCATNAEVAKACDAVVTMLPGPPQIKEVYLGKDGLLAGAHDGLILIDSSTADPETIKEVAKVAAEHKVELIDAPVGGGVPKAQSGELIMLASGGPQAIENASGIFDAVGSRTIYAGPVGSGKALKLVNNLITGMQCCIFAESLTLAEKSGVDFDTLMELLGGNLMWVVETIAGKMNQHDFTPGFKTALMHKDLGLAMDMANSSSVMAPFTASARELFQQAKINGWGDMDFTCIQKIYQADYS